MKSGFLCDVFCSRQINLLYCQKERVQYSHYSFPHLSMCCSSGNCCVVCKIVKALVILVLTLTSVAAFIGVWNTHMVNGAWTFGSQEGSLALLVLVVSFSLWGKKLTKMCPCGSKGACGGCPCGKDNCACDKGCGCGKENCACPKDKDATHKI